MKLAAEYMKNAGYGDEVNDEIIETVKSQIVRLKPLHIGKWGQIKEWYDEDSFFMRGFYNQAVQRKHRHISHLLSLYPFRQITPDDEALANAALTTLKDRGKKSTGWGLAIRLLSYARLHKGNDCDEIVEHIIKSTILKNLFGTHPPFQIDGNFGFVSGITEMLMQSYNGKIYILPALPSKWKNGKVTGLLAKGGVIVDIEWKDGKVASYSLEGKGTYNVIVNGETKETVLDGKKVTFNV